MTPIGLTKRTIFAALITLAASVAVRAQPAPAGAPAAPAPLNSPEVSTDGRITFRLRAPQAKEVSIQPVAIAPMVRGDEGVWSVTVGPWTPDVYAYHFIVDGTRMPAPSNGALLKTSRTNFAGELGQLGGWQSQVVVPNPAKPEPLGKDGDPPRHRFLRRSLVPDDGGVSRLLRLHSAGL
ncbi:hypothetical protein MASR2M8_21150 [Opitutaceae bacterium]